MVARRITVTQDVMDAFSFLWGLYSNACEGTDEEWHTEEEKKKLMQFYEKIYGKYHNEQTHGKSKEVSIMGLT